MMRFHHWRRLACALAGAGVAVVAIWTAEARPALAAPAGHGGRFQPRTIDDCERIQEPLAYNACLASFGPARRGGGPMTTPEVADSGGHDGAPRAAGSRGKRGGERTRSARGRSGRASASFTIPGAAISERTLRRR